MSSQDRAVPDRAPTCGDSGGRTKDGSPCGAVLGLSSDTGLCVVHDPARSRQSKLDRQEGGRVSAIARRVAREVEETTAPEKLPDFEPDTLERLARWHQWAARAVAVGWISGRTGDSICRHLKELRPTLEKLGTERRLRAYEAAIRKWRKSGNPATLFELIEKDRGS